MLQRRTLSEYIHRPEGVSRAFPRPRDSRHTRSRVVPLLSSSFALPRKHLYFRGSGHRSRRHWGAQPAHAHRRARWRRALGRVDGAAGDTTWYKEPVAPPLQARRGGGGAGDPVASWCSDQPSQRAIRCAFGAGVLPARA